MDFLSDLQVEAWIVYLVVLLIALFSSTFLVEKRLGDLRDRWFFAETWFLWIVYSLVPLALVYVLDYNGAMHDTSLLSAAIVAATYQAVLSGQSSAASVPEQATTYWTPFVKWTDSLFDSIDRYVNQSETKFVEFVQERNAKNPNKLIAAKLENLAKNKTKRPLKLKNELAALGQNSQGTDDHIQLCAAHARSMGLNWIALRKGIIGFSHFVELQFNPTHIWRAFLPLLVFALVLVFGLPYRAVAIKEAVIELLNTSPKHDEQGFDGYYAWRLTKEHNTPEDLREAASHFEERADKQRTKLGQTAEASNNEGLAVLTKILQKSDKLGDTSLDAMLGVFAKYAGHSNAAACVASYSLLPALESPYRPALEHVQATLSQLADVLAIPIDAAGPRNWTFDDKLNEADRQRQIKLWSTTLNSGCKPYVDAASHETPRSGVDG